MGWFIFALIFFFAALIGIGIAIFSPAKLSGIFTAIGAAIVGGILLFFGTFWTNSVGEAKIMVNSVDRTVVGRITEPSSGFKAPWVDFVEFDTFNQGLVYAGHDKSPEYAGGTVNGKEITVTVGGTTGGSTKADIDATFNYTIDPNQEVTYKGKTVPAIYAIYYAYRSQEAFTKAVVEKQVLSVARVIPNSYSAVDFRGAKRPEAENKFTDTLNDRLTDTWGVEFAPSTIQDVRYPDSVEKALTAIEEANQEAQKAEAQQRTAKAIAEKQLIQAQGNAAAAVAQAQGEAQANAILNASLTPLIIEQRRIEALQEAAKNGKLIVDGKGGVLIQGQ